jgi:hypothetical protein
MFAQMWSAQPKASFWLATYICSLISRQAVPVKLSDLKALPSLRYFSAPTII